MYIGNNVRPKLDKEIEALAQAISKNVSATSVEYSVAALTNYSLARLFSRLVQLKGGLNEASINIVLGVLEAVKQEFARKVAGTYLDRQRNLNGEVFSELL
jgi:hypothetical protein